jgi:hypothetical protein
MKLSLFEVAQLDGTETNFRAKVKVLCDTVNRHVLEEEAQMLPQVQHSGFDMVELADQIRMMKEEMRLQGIPEISRPIEATPAKTSTQELKIVEAPATRKATEAASLAHNARKTQTKAKAPEVTSKVKQISATKTKRANAKTVTKVQKTTKNTKPTKTTKSSKSTKVAQANGRRKTSSSSKKRSAA